MKKMNLIAGLLSVLLLTFSCSNDETVVSITGNGNVLSISGAGDIVSNDIQLAAFQDIELRNYCNVEVVSGTAFKAIVSDYSNLVQYLKLEVIGSKLVIRTEPENVIINNSKAKAVIYVPVAKLNSLNISGSGNIKLKSEFNNITNVGITGSGSIKGEVTSTTNNLKATTSGSGTIDFLNIQSENANCTISGSGSIQVAVTNLLNATITGSGSVFYQGSPTVTKSIRGSGSVIKL